MFTKNYYAALATAFVANDSAGANAVDYLGTNCTFYKWVSNSSSCHMAFISAAVTLSAAISTGGKDLAAIIGDVSSKYGGVYFGEGTTPATVDDYKLESIITSGMSISEQTEESSLVDNVVTKKASYALKNTGSSDVTIGEIGYFKNICCAELTTGKHFLIERTVLDEPITIPAGGTGIVNYEIKIQVPTAPTE